MGASFHQDHDFRGASRYDKHRSSKVANFVKEGVVWDEVRVGERPVGVTLGPLRRRLYVGCSYSGDLHVLEVVGKKLVPVTVIKTGWQPHDVVISPDNKQAYVALYAANQVGVIDLQQFRALVDATGYSGHHEVEILSSRWWSEDPEHVVKTVQQRFAVAM